MENIKYKKIIISLISGVLVLIIIYIFMRSSCIQKINFIPAGVSNLNGNDSFNRPTTAKESYYSITIDKKDTFGRSISKQFKTQNEAINYCISKKFSSED